MNKKQKTMLYRIIIAAVLVAAVTVLEKILELNVWIAAVLYMVPYFVIGYDILKKAWKGILKRQVFDENFLHTKKVCEIVQRTKRCWAITSYFLVELARQFGLALRKER